MGTGATSHSDRNVTRGSCHCGAVRWEFRGEIPDATICNCTACRRYGVLWAYDYDGEAIHIEDPTGALTAYVGATRSLTFNFCRHCGNLVSWRGLQANDKGQTRIAINLRLAEPDEVARIPLQRFDGLHSFEDLERDGRTVAEVWF
ncbi:GFA family protein [Phyllobacterium sp. SYP-B3895]|uniref:GFA family protein n=1 Tax=Phyllobacterium sp. SYP-B3895 TaxID=2663240 RepID=UPI001299C585|nr:GFA family protein [Phyllobacterium sp. SYP-B3895]MRG57494.1 GFA family protein [Phyllobacterium sp. SYP-B3895]